MFKLSNLRYFGGASILTIGVSTSFAQETDLESFGADTSEGFGDVSGLDLPLCQDSCRFLI